MNINELKNLPCWFLKSYPTGMELRYCRIRSKSGKLLALIPFLLIFIASWIIGAFLDSWVFGAEKFELGAFLLFFAAVSFALVGVALFQNLLEQTLYMFTPLFFMARVERFWTRKKEFVIQKEAVLNIQLIKSQVKKSEIHRVAVQYDRGNGSSALFFMVGENKTGSSIIAEILKSWSGTEIVNVGSKEES